MIRPDVVNLFYKGYINIEKHYATIKGRNVDFRTNMINELYRLEHNEIQHALFKSPIDRAKQDALEKVA